MSIYLSLKETRKSYKYIWNIATLEQNWTETENFDNCFTVSFDCVYKSHISSKFGH